MSLAGAAVLALGAVPVSAAAATTVSWSDQNVIPGTGGSSDSPAITQCTGNTPNVGVYLLWKGIGNDQRLFFEKLDVYGHWGNQVPLPFGGTSTAPSLTCSQGVLMAVWKGIAGDQRIFYSTSSDGGVTWSPQDSVSSIGLTDTAPSIAWYWRDTYQGFRYEAYLVFRGIGSDQQVYYDVWNPESATKGATGVWEFVEPVPGAFTDVAPTASYFFGSTGFGGVGVVWKATNSNHFWYQHFDLNTDTWNANSTVIAADGGTSTRVAVGGGPLMAWKGIDPDQRLYYSVGVSGCADSSQPSCWQPQQVVPTAGGSSTGPGLAGLSFRNPDGSFDSAYVLVWKGLGNDQRLFYSLGR